MEYSYWEHKHWFEKQDIVIVGAGLTGTLSAIAIKKKFPNRKVAVIEAHPIPRGASTKNAGFACFATIGEILDDLSTTSENKVIETISLRYSGLSLLKELVPSVSMLYSGNGGCELFNTSHEYDKCIDKLDYVNSLIQEATGLSNCLSKVKIEDSGVGNRTSQLYKSAIFNSNEGSLNPVKLIKQLNHIAINLGVSFHYGLKVNSYNAENDKVYVDVNGMELICQELIFCTNAFAQDHFPQEDIKPARNIVLVSVPHDDVLQGNYHCEQGYIYFRNIENRLLIGGARNINLLAESTSKFGFNPEIESFLKEFAHSKLGLKNLQFPYKWSGIIATGQSKFPIIKKVENHVYTALRMGGMGVAISSAVAQQVADLIEL